MERPISPIREHLFRAVDDTHLLLDSLQEAKLELVSNRDPMYNLQQAEVYINKINDNFALIVKELENAKKNTTSNSTLPG